MYGVSKLFTLVSDRVENWIFVELFGGNTGFAFFTGVVFSILEQVKIDTGDGSGDFESCKYFCHFFDFKGY